MPDFPRDLSRMERYASGVPSPARYEPRKLDNPEPGRTHAVFDTFVQSFVVGEPATTWAGAVSASARLNKAYRSAVGE